MTKPAPKIVARDRVFSAAMKNLRHAFRTNLENTNEPANHYVKEALWLRRERNPTDFLRHL